MRDGPSRRTTAWLASVVAVLLAADVVAAAGITTESAGAAPPPTTLGTISSQAVVNKVALAGTLHRDEQSTLVYGVRVIGAQPAPTSGGSARGGAAADPGAVAPQRNVLTALANAGEVVSQGQQLWTVDAIPTVLLYGGTAAYRVLQSGVPDGEDVQQLEANLTALGFADGGAMTVDSHFDAATTQAVMDWQTSLGVGSSGSVSPEDIVFAPGARRVLATKSAIGDVVAPGTELLAVSGTETVATVEAPIDGAGALQAGAHVDLDLGGRAQMGGTVRTVSRDVTRASATASPQVAVDITPDDQGAAGVLVDGTAVTATVTVARGVSGLTVPVSALHAGRNGATLVTLVDKAGKSRQVQVAPGVSGGGLVEITGQGLAAGDRIVLG